MNAPDELEAAIARSGVDHGAAIAVEEFVEGHEGFYDTITIDGEVVHGVRHALLPERARGDADALDLAAVRRHQPHRRGAGYDELKEMGRAVDRARSASRRRRRTWSGSSGRRASTSPRSVAARPGVRCWDLYAAGNDIDIYREWANGHRPRARVAARRRGASRPGIIALRPDRDGDDHAATTASTTSSSATASGSSTPTCRRPGTPTQPVEAGYMANAWVRMRHPDYDVLRGMLDDVGRTVQVHA